MNPLTVDTLLADPAQFLARLEAGEQFLVVRGDKPVAEVVPLPCKKRLRPYGLAAGEFTLPPDFDDPLPEDILREFEGR